MQVGIRCTDGYLNSWLTDIDAFSMCNAFIDQIRGSDNIAFYFNLIGAAPSFNNGDPLETCLGCGGPDSVDFYLINTHGGNWGSGAALAAWEVNSVGWSPNMRFGAVGEQLKVFAMYACDTLATADGGFWNRWASAFAGGVKVLLGAHDLVYDGNGQKGTEFAGRMQNGEPIGQSWLEAVWYADNDNHPSVVTTGADQNDCGNRLGVNLPSLNFEPALRDGQIGYWCALGWNGV